MRRPMLIAYDIACPKRRYRVHRILQRWRLDGQKSVHECLLTETEAQALIARLRTHIDPDEDSLFTVWLSGHRPIHVQGRARNLRQFLKRFHFH